MTSTAAPVAATAATAFPLPFTTSLTVAYTLPSSSALTVTLLDALGRPVYQQSIARQSAGSNTFTIADCAGLPPGCYSLCLTTATSSQVLRVVRVAP